MSKVPKIKQTKDWLKKNWLSLIAIIISVISLWYTYKQSLLTFRLAHLHIEPEIKTQFILKKGESNPTLAIINAGNIPVVSVRFHYKAFILNKETRKIETGAEGVHSLAPGTIYSEHLKPGEQAVIQLLGIEATGRLVVYEFDVKYFRESDMLEYNRNDYYFIDNNIVLNHSQFRNSPLYRDVMSNISSFSFDTPKGEPNQVLTQPYFQHSESP
jgi:hypothetical protein